jgi:hypothetical protein
LTCWALSILNPSILYLDTSDLIQSFQTVATFEFSVLKSGRETILSPSQHCLMLV